jgi:hypothetical protein
MATTNEVAVKKTAPLYESKQQALDAVKKTETYKVITTQINLYKKQADEYLKEEITSDAQAKAIDNFLSEKKKYEKNLDDKGLEIRRPYNATAGFIKEVFDGFTEEVKLSTPLLQKKITDWQKAIAEKERLEKLAIDKEAATLKAWVTKVSTDIMKAESLDDLTEVLNKSVKPFKVELFQLLDPEVVKNTLTAVKASGKNRWEQIKSKNTNDPNDAVDPVEEAAEMVSDLTDAIEEAQVATKAFSVAPAVKFNTSLRKTIKFKPWKTTAEVDRRFLCVDDAAVKQYLSENLEDIKKHLESNNGKPTSRVIYGIEFFYEEGATTR